MGEFDFGLWERILEKLSSGGALTPEEQAAYDGLFAGAGEGLDLTGQPDFNKLVNSYYNDVSGNINREFEKAYGENVVQTPDGRITFSRPGSIIENFQRRGQSVTDGPAMAALSEGLRNRNKGLEDARLNALTHAYQDMVPVRQQNLDAIYKAGLLAQGAGNRRVSAMGGARGGGGGAEGPGGEPTKLPLPDQPDLMDRILPGLLAALGTGGIAMLRDRMNRQEQPNRFSKSQLDEAAGEIVGRNPFQQASAFDVPSDRASLDEGHIKTPLDNPLQTKNTLADENYLADQLLGPGMTMGGGDMGQANAIAPSFEPASFTPPATAPQMPVFNPYQDISSGATFQPYDYAGASGTGNMNWDLYGGGNYQQPSSTYDYMGDWYDYGSDSGYANSGWDDWASYDYGGGYSDPGYYYEPSGWY